MRTNLPVTQNEFVLDDQDTLVSMTDMDSRITYANPKFVAVSGFTREELLGQPHNLVRHPDMPAEAFRDLWATVRRGATWSACVKNRRKNGDHYWVLANVTPVMRDGQPVGYMSVRTKPTRAQVQQAEALYARLRDEQQAGRHDTALEGGLVIRTTATARLMRALRPGLVARIAAVLAVPVAGVAVAAPPALAAGAWGVAGLIALGLATVAGAARLVKGLVLAPLQTASQAAGRIAAGDLTQRLQQSADDEVGALMGVIRQLNVNLQAVVGDVRREVDGLGGTAGDVAQGSLDLSQRTEAQASSLQQTAAAVEQMEGTVQRNADAARDANRLAHEASSVAERGGAAMGEVVSTMQAITASSRRIGDIVHMIEAIAFQTNLLALNAAVEAARAGEQGRGFAVVAGEVRALAQRSTGAAREIRTLIDDSATKVGEGTQTVERAGATMRDLRHAVEQVSRLITEITTATEQQAIGITQVNQAIAALDSTTQQNAALVEESAAAAGMLRQQAEVLKESVSVFQVA